MAKVKRAAGGGKAPRPPRDIQPTKAPRELCRRVGAIAALTGETIDEVWGRVAGEAVTAEFVRVTSRKEV